MLIISFLLFALTPYAQPPDSNKIKQIDSLIFGLSNSVKAEGYYSDIDVSGLIHKKAFIFFKKRIGSFSSDIIYHDTLIYSIENVSQYKKDDKVVVENYYFSNNSLIKYEIMETIVQHLNEKDVLKHHVIAYFSEDKQIGLTKKINDDYVFDVAEQDKIKNHAKSEIDGYVGLLKVQKN